MEFQLLQGLKIPPLSCDEEEGSCRKKQKEEPSMRGKRAKSARVDFHRGDLRYHFHSEAELALIVR